MKTVLLLSLLYLQSLFCSSITEKPIVVVIPSYNNSKWANWNVRSVLTQRYSNYRVIYIDDCSKDETGSYVYNIAKKYGRMPRRSIHEILFDDLGSIDIIDTANQFAHEINGSPVFFTVVVNKNRAGALCNLYRAISSCKDNEIIVTLDGDDWFSDSRVLQKINEAYSKSEIWLTHGGMIEHPSGSQEWCEPVPLEIIEANAIRSFKCPTHLRTFYAGLFKQIKLEDLLYEGKFFSMTWDMAMMYPMIEMCAERHAFITAPTYIYNMINPINDNKVNAELQRTLDFYIRHMEPYKRIDSLPGVTSHPVNMSYIDSN